MESPDRENYTSNSSNDSSAFDNVPRAPVIPIYAIIAAYNEDPNPVKLNLSFGVYRTEEGKPHVMNAVRRAEQLLLDDVSATKEYLPITGMEQFNKLSARLVFGTDSPAFKENRVTTVQCLSGSGSLRVGGDFLAKHYHHHTIYIPEPTYGNHPNFFLAAGLQVKTYRYYDPATRGLDFQGLLDDLGHAAFGAIILLHACGHNPTGIDPTLQQWNQIRQLMRLKRQLPFFDCAYQGFVSGNLDTDAQPIRMFVADGDECLVAQSYSKIMGLYAERIGALSIVCKSADAASKVESQLKLLIRPMYSNPPIHGAAIVATILNNREMFDEWIIEMKAMIDRLRGLRLQLYEALNDRDWKIIVSETFQCLNFD